MEFYEGAIKTQGFSPLDVLSDNGYSSSVCYLAQKNGRKYVFKFPNMDTFSSRGILDGKDVFSIRRESELLKLLKGKKGIPQEAYLFDCCNFHGVCECKCPKSFSPLFLRKEYIEGQELVRGKKVRGENKEFLINLVKFFHQKGYARLDLSWPGNVIVDSNDFPWIVDLGNASTMGDKVEIQGNIHDVDFRLFEEFRRQDHLDLARICA
ncbi:MAG: hypothetical protein AABX03_01355 [Nanoarchaeota archaeon]